MRQREKFFQQMQLPRIFNFGDRNRLITREQSSSESLPPPPISLADVARSVEVEIVALRSGASDEGREWEQRFIEFGIIENARVRILHEGPLGKDPLVILVGGMRIALRRQQASSIIVRYLAREELR